MLEYRESCCDVGLPSVQAEESMMDEEELEDVAEVLELDELRSSEDSPEEGGD